MSKIEYIPTRDCGTWDDEAQYRLFDEVTGPDGVKYILLVPGISGIPVTDQNVWFKVPAVTEGLDDAAGLARSIRERTGSGVISGLEVTAQEEADLTVAVSEGVCYLPSGLRFAVDAVAALTIGTVEAHKNRAARVYVSSAGAVTVVSAFGTTAVAGAKTYTIATNAVATDTVTLIGVEFTAVETGATGNQFNVGADAAATAANLGAVVGANATVSALYAVTVAGAAITLTEKAWGGGNTPADATKTGTIAVTNGAATTSAAAGAATAPALPSGSVTLATVAVAAAATTVETGNITKNRSMLVSDAIFKTES